MRLWKAELNPRPVEFSEKSGWRIAVIDIGNLRLFQFWILINVAKKDQIKTVYLSGMCLGTKGIFHVKYN